MSKTIDERVVSMQFDNKNFESNVSTTMSTLDKLKQKLHLKGASKGLENVNAAAKKVDLTTIYTAIESLKSRFSSLNVVGTTALVNLTNSAVNAGKRMISALTIDPIKSGFSEYETKINAIQTIMSNTASKGTTMADVTKVINELNTYADKTIYNFAEMTKNIGTFTAAGVGLEDSAAAIQGIANLAAASGSTSQQASTAMYQLSQALSAGTVKLMDWNSVVNAGMGGEKFQEALKATAREHGVAVDSLIEKNGSFRDSLQEGWITADILNTTLKKFTVEGAEEYAQAMLKSGKYTQEQADALIAEARNMEDAATKVKTFTQLWDTLKESAQSGWSQSWELIVGDFEEARETLTEISDTVGGMIEVMSDVRNGVIEGAFTSNWKKVSNVVAATGIDMTLFKEKLIEVGKAHNVITDEMIAEAGSFEKSLRSGWLTSDIFSEALKSMAGGLSEIEQSTEDMTQRLETFQTVVNDIWQGDYADGDARIKALTEAGYDYATMQELVNKTVDGHTLTLEDLNMEQAANLGFTEEQVVALEELAAQAEETGTPLNELIEDLAKPSGRELLFDSLMNPLRSLAKIFKSIGDAWNGIFPTEKQGEKLYSMLESFNSFSKSLIMSDESAEKLSRTFKGLFAALDIVTSVLGGGFRIALKAICRLLGMADVDILSVTAKVGDAIVAFRDWLFTNNILARGFNKVVDLVREFVTAFWNLPAVQTFIANLEKKASFALDNIKSYFQGGTERIEAFIERVRAMDDLSMDDIATILKDFKDNVVGYFLGIGAGFDNIGEAISAFAQKVKDKFQIVGDKFDWLKNKITSIIDWIRSKVDIGDVLGIGIAVVLVRTIMKIGSALETLASPIEGIASVLENFGDVLSSWSKKLKADAFNARATAILKLAIAILVLAGAIALLTALDQTKMWSAVGAIAALAVVLTLMTLAISKIGSGGKGGITGLKGIGKSLKTAVSAFSVLMLSGSLLLLAGALKMMADLDPKKALQNVVILGVLMGMLAGVTILLSKFAPSLSTGSIMLLAMAGAIKLMVSALKSLDGVNIENPGKTIGLLISMIVGLALISRLCQGLSWSSAIGIIGLAVGLKLLIGVIGDIANFNVDAVTDNVAAYAIVLGTIAALMLASRLAGKNALQAGVGLIAMSAALWILVQTFRLLSEISPGDLKRCLTTVSTLLLVFGAVIAATYFAGKHAIKAGIMLLLMAGALVLLTGVIAILKSMQPDGLWRAVGVIAVLEAMFAGLIAVTHFAKGCTATLIILSVVIVLLTAAIIALAQIDSTSLNAATSALIGVLGTFALLTYVSQFLKTGKKTWARNLATIAALVVVAAALAMVIKTLASCNPGSTIEIAASLSLLLAALSGALVIVSNSKSMTSKKIMSVMQTLAVLVGVVAALAVIIGVLAKCNPGSTMEIAASLSLLVLTLSAACVILGTVGNKASMALPAALAMTGIIAALGLVLGLLAGLNVGPTLEIAASLSLLLLSLSAACVILNFVSPTATAAIPAALAMSLIVGVLGLVLGALAALNIAPSLETAASLSVLLLSLSAACVILGVAGMFGPAGLIGIGILAALIVGIGGLIVGIGALVDKFPVLETFLDKGIPILEKIGYAIGSFFGNIVGGFATGALTAGLPEMANDLSEFMTNLQPFVDGVTSIDPASLEGAKTLVGMIAVLTATDILDSLTSWFTGGTSLADFATQLVPFGEAMSEFSAAIAGVNSEDVSNAAIAGQALAEMAAALPNMGGVASWFAGENDIAEFAQRLVPFGEAMAGFSEAISGVDSASVTSAANAGKAIAEMAAAIPNMGGVASWFAGENDMTEFGSQLTAFGENIKAYSVAVQGTDTEAITNSAAAGKAIAEMAADIPNLGGVVSWFTGDNDMATFGSQLMSFGIALSTYGNAVAGLNNDDIDNSVKAGQSLAEMAGDIPNLGGVVSWFAGDNDLATFGTQIAAFGMALTGYSQTVAGLDTGAIDNSVAAANNLAELTEAAKTAMSFDLGQSGLSKFGSSITVFGTHMSAYSNTVSGINISAMANSTTQFIRIANMVKGLSGTDFGSLSSFGTSLGSISSAGVDAFISAFENAYDSAETAGSNFAAKVESGVKSRMTTLKVAVAALAASAAEAIKTKYSAFYSAGAYLVQGFANGISSNTYLARAKATAMANAAEQAAKAALDSHSPSRVFIKIGEYVPQGFAIGIGKFGGKVKNAASNMANTALDGTKSAIARVASALNADLDAQPTIRPVLDLSEISAGASTVNSLLSMTPSVGVRGALSSISYSMNRRRQNGADNEVVTAINKLRKDVGNLENRSYSVGSISYSAGDEVSSAIDALVRAIRVEGRA